jgi:two-component system, cell cycle sensor histidine kinase and response regulator CckA
MKPAILLVDDDVLLLALTAELLCGLGYGVRTARDGNEALTILENRPAVDLLVTDVQMPGLHGFELARRAKALKPTLAVVYCTGNPEAVADEMGPALGPILSKPISAERLHREITRVHQGQASSQGNAL